jgi:YidC/Oxa1 family membrane protein insertase
VNFDIAYKVMLPALQYFHELTRSYGWAIILLTLAVRMVVWPLVAQSTRSMQRMSKLQPELKALQERYKGNPEQLQEKMTEFAKKNKLNPMGGCLPTLIQLPILFALYATFSGPPFCDRYVDVKVNVVAKVDSSTEKSKETSGGNSAFIGKDGKTAKIVVYPGDSTVAVGDSLNFGTRVIEGELSSDFEPSWKVVGPGSKNNLQGAESYPTEATIDRQGHAVFLKEGEYHVGAKIPGVAKHESFGFISELGKVANGVDLLKPANWDTLLLILFFGATMYLSQKFTITTPKAAPGDKLDEQQIIQQQTAQTMPFVATAMFIFIPLPTGVYLYLVLSNVVQTLQTWLLMRTSEQVFVDVGEGGGQNGKNGKHDAQADKNASVKSGNDTGDGGARMSGSGKKKQKRKKNN